MARSIIITGPAGCGKTRNAELLRRTYKLARIQDEWSPGDEFNARDTLILTNVDRSTALAAAKGCPVFDFNTAMRQTTR